MIASGKGDTRNAMVEAERMYSASSLDIFMDTSSATIRHSGYFLNTVGLKDGSQVGEETAYVLGNRVWGV